MDKLALLKKVNKKRLLLHLGINELKLFLLMIAYCKENAEGEILRDSIKTVFGEGFTSEELWHLCNKLEQLEYIRATQSCRNSHEVAVVYHILIH